jgi:carbamoyltransferase
MLILGIHRDPYHSTGAAVLCEDGARLRVVAVSQERVDRIKHSHAYPDEAIDYCLKTVGAESVTDCDMVVADYIFRPDWRTFQHYQPYQPPGLYSALRFHLSRVRRLRKITHRIPPNKVYFVNHHLAHAYAAFCGSGFEEAAILVVDGHGSVAPGVRVSAGMRPGNEMFETQSLFVGRKGKIELLEYSAKTGVGMMYEAFTKFLGFGELEEGKTMGLAPYGAGVNGRHVEFRAEFTGMETDYSSLVDIFAPRGSWVKPAGLTPCTRRGDQTNPYYSRIAWEVQNETESAMLHLARHARVTTGQRNLCLSGGVALNSVANYKILQAGLFDNIWIQPASSDSGIPLGCVLYGYYRLAGGRSPWSMEHAYLAREYSDEEIERAISEQAAHVRWSLNGTARRTAELLAQGQIVGWLQGASEYGPRALGHRSILVDPRKAENRDILNARVKHREGFRPFAPAVLLERSEDYFDLSVPSPFMLLVPPVRNSRRKEIPAVVHVDGTGRVQTVTRGQNDAFFDLVHAFHEITGVPVVLNTSFNLSGEPIVETPQDALRSFLSTQMDALVVGKFLVTKR